MITLLKVEVMVVEEHWKVSGDAGAVMEETLVTSRPYLTVLLSSWNTELGQEQKILFMSTLLTSQDQKCMFKVVELSV